MDIQTRRALESLFDKYSYDNMEEVSTDKHFFEIKSYKAYLKNGESIIRDKLVKVEKNATGASIVVPFLDGNTLLMVVQPRIFAPRGVDLCFPGGMIDEGETPKEAAIREFGEETGYTCFDLEELATFCSDESHMDDQMHIFVSHNPIKKSGQLLDKDEYLEPFIITLDDAYEAMKEGYVINSASQLAITTLLLERAKNGK